MTEPAQQSTTGARRPLVWFVLLFAVSRVAFHVLGLRFSTEHVAAIMHFVDLELLRDRLLESLWYLHGQPPLMSVILGVLLKTCGDAWPIAAEALFVGLGAATGSAIVVLLRRLGFAPALAVAVALGFALLPDVVVYEHYLFSTHLVLACLVLACVPLERALVLGRRRDWFWFLLAAALVVNLRNVFHLVWWAALLALALRLRAGERRRILAAALVPLLLAAGWYAKNQVVHGRFEASSWLGFGLARKTYHQLALADRRVIVAAGQLDPIAGVEVFGDVNAYAAVLGRPPATGVPLLDSEVKSSGWPNYHHAIYLQASDRMRAEALRLIRAFPAAYWRDVAKTVRQLFLPATMWRPVATPRAQLGAYATAIDRVVHGELGLPGVTLWSLLAGLVLVVFLPKLVLALARPRRLDAEDQLYVFFGVTLVYLYAVAVLLDTNETMRHRLKGDGLLVLAAVLAIRRGWRWWRGPRVAGA